MRHDPFLLQDSVDAFLVRIEHYHAGAKTILEAKQL